MNRYVRGGNYERKIRYVSTVRIYNSDNNFYEFSSLYSYVARCS